MYSSSHSVSAPMNGMDGSGTINPAALNSTAVLPPPTVTAPGVSPRGIKRSRSPDQYGGDLPVEGDHEDDDQNRRKRGRPPKTPRASGNGATLVNSQHTSTPSSAIAGLPPAPSVVVPAQQSRSQRAEASPLQTSPPVKAAPTKGLIKALPTVRDHTTDQLSEDGDEYIPKEFDEAGEKKVDALGYPQEGREYKCRTFRVPNRGDKLFMLATECARVLGYRDSYLLFNKNRSLYKIIATQIEKEDLIHQDVLPYSYRSRQIAIVTAKSMFRQFGSRVIVNGRRVRDDYWESKARKQGFTEEDLAGEKRPGAAKARDAAAAAAAAAAAEAANATNLLPTLNHGDVVYSHAIESMSQGVSPGLGTAPTTTSLAPLPMIHLAPTAEDPRLREYSSLPRPRQEMAGQPYQDRTQPSTRAEILNQASQTADFSKILNSQRAFRNKSLDEFYTKQREVPVSAHPIVPPAPTQPQIPTQPPPRPQSQPQSQSQSQAGQAASLDSSPAGSHTLPSPQMASSGMINPGPPQQTVMTPQPSILAPQVNYSQPTSHSQPPIAKSPIRGIPQSLRPDLLHQRASNPTALTSAAQTPPFGYPSQTQQIWGQPPPHPQPSPIPAASHLGMAPYATAMHPPPQTPPPLPHHGQQPQPVPPSQQPPPQSPHTQPRPPQVMSQPLMHLQGVPPPSLASSLGYQGAGASAFPAMAGIRAMYPSTQGPGQQFLTTPNQHPGLSMGISAGVGLAAWPSPAGGPMPGSAQPGQSGSPLGGWSGY